MKRSRLTPYKNWTENELKHALKVHISRMHLEGKLVNLWTDVVEEAFSNPLWFILREFNGCTIVQDEFHPCPACFVHDYAWLTGQGGKVADRIFYHLMIAEGMSKAKARRRWFAVRVGWYSFFMWKYIFKRKLQQPSSLIVELDKYFLNK